MEYFGTKTGRGEGIVVGMENDKVSLRIKHSGGHFLDIKLPPEDAKSLGNRLIGVSNVLLEELK